MSMKLVWIKTALAVLVAVAVTVGFVRFKHAPGFSVRTLYVAGPVEGSGVTEVTQAVQTVPLGNLLLTDIDAVRAAVREVSWVKDARVVRVWPDALRIDVERYEAVAIWEDGRLVAADGRLFVANDESIERLAQMPVLSGDPAYAAQAVAYLPQFQSAVSKMPARLKGIYVSFRGSWRITVESQVMPNVTIELGRAFTEATPVEKLQRVTRHFSHICRILRGYPQQIDARYRDAFAAQLPNRASVRLWLKEHDPDQLKKGES